MSSVKKAAIDLEDIGEKPLDQVSAADFLTALSNSGQKGALVFRAWPEKKKLELFIEPEFNKGISVGGLVSRLAEKKKYEIEKDLRTELVRKLAGSEVEIDPRHGLIDPVEIASEVVRQLKAAGR